MFISTYIDLHIFDIDNSIRTSYRVTLSTFFIKVFFLSHPCIFRNMSFKNKVISFVTVPLPWGTKCRFLVRLLCLGWTFSKASEVTWILGAGGASCDETCRARGGCNEEEWPKTENEFLGRQNLSRWFLKIVIMMVIKIIMIRMIPILWEHRNDNKQ